MNNNLPILIFFPQPSCLSTDISRDIKTNSEECKLLLKIYKNSNNKRSSPDYSISLDPDSRCNKSPPQPADPVPPELSNTCQESFEHQNTDDTKTFPKMVDAANRSKIIRDNMKATGEKCPETGVLRSDPDTDECGHSDVQGSPGDASTNEETSEIPTMDDSSSFDARRTRRSIFF